MNRIANYRISYAQNREDVIINAFFPDIEKGVYLDVGANDPEDDSVTKIFYDKGWAGINIEPSPRLNQKLAVARKRDKNILVGIATKKEKLKFREYDNHGLSTFSTEMKQQYEKAPDEKTSKYIEYEVDVRPLRDVLKEAKAGHIHFMKVDVEGFEYEVLASNDWEKYRPELICIEANHIIKDWHTILDKAKYELVFNDGLNEYFLSYEASKRKELFDYAQSIVLDKPIITPGLARQLAIHQSIQLRLADIEKELNQTQQELIVVIGQRNALFSQLQQYRHLKSQLRMIFVNFRRLYRARLEKLNGPARLKSMVRLKTGLKNSDSRKKLSQSALEYDKRALRETRIINGRTRRAAYWLLNNMDKLFILFVKVGFRLLRKIFRKLRYISGPR